MLVALFFMNLLHDRGEDAVIFGASFLFLAIFIVLTSTDLFFRGDIAVKGSLEANASQLGSKLKKPWISSPELISHGKELFTVQCISCHGIEGKGDGPAASALNPPPRNFHVDEGWKNGRKPTMVFKTLTEGLPPSAMASYSTLPADDRWAIAHYVLTLGSKPQEDTPDDFKKIGVDPSKEGGGMKVAVSIPIELALDQITVPEVPSSLPQTQSLSPQLLTRLGPSLYQAHCIECHGAQGNGEIRVKNLGVNPTAYVVTEPFQKAKESLRSQANFDRLVLQGLPGDLMPGVGQLSTTELKELYAFVQELARQ
jgi:mono/diheme cytochrome c family protein